MTNLDQLAYAVGMEQLNVYEAKSQFSELLNRVEHGEEIVIARAGRPVARLVPLVKGQDPRVAGAWRGRVVIAPDFDELPPAVAQAFLGEDPPVATAP